MSRDTEPGSLDNPMSPIAESSAAPVAAQETAERPTRVYVGRAAIALLRLPSDTEPMFTVPAARSLSEGVEAAVREALSGDPRVAEVLDDLESGLAVDNARTISFTDTDLDSSDVGELVTDFQALRFNGLVAFRMRIPRKNQPKYRSRDDVPSDDYLVLWDGISVYVQWAQDAPFVTGSGGHVVFDVLRDVVAKAGYKFEVVACSPGCHHKFLHLDFVTFEGSEPPSVFQSGGQTPVGTSVRTPAVWNVDDVAVASTVYPAMLPVLDLFAETRSVSNVVLDLEQRARFDSEHLLEIAYARASRSRLLSKAGVVDLWALRGLRRQSRRLTSGMWLALAGIEARAQRWRVRNARLGELINEHGLAALADEFDTYASAIERLDVSFIRAGLERTEQNIEARMLLFATFTGAAAAVGGAAVAALLT